MADDKINCNDDACELPASSTPPSDSPSFDPGPGRHVLLFADPMCSWCWGFQPELKKVVELIKGRTSFHVVMGGLRPGTTESWKGEMQTYIHHHWQDVEKKTGQPFDYSRMDDDNFIYDTEPACRAVVSARELMPEKALSVYHDLQRAFYAEGRDITSSDVIADVVAAAGIPRDKFETLFASTEARELLAHDFARTRAFGVKGFPSIVCAEDGQFAFLTLGYRSFDSMKPDLEAWLAG